jgi:predicted Zn-dependent peptidase
MRIKHKYYKSIDEKIIIGEHSSGLKVFVLPKKDFRKKHAYFMTKYGSIYNEFVDNKGEVVKKPEGIAHFLEHKIFEEDEGNIFEKFALLGARVNAFTKFDATAYNFSTVDNFYESLKLLIDFVQNPHITDENVEKEKGIIEQEIKMYLDNPDWKVYFNALKAMYKKNPVREDIAGSVESINKITKDDLLDCYNYFYSPKNMIVFVIGDVNYERVFETVESSLSQEFIKRDYKPELVTGDEKPEVNQKCIREKNDVSQPKFIYAFKEVEKYESEELFKRAIAIKIALIALFGNSSPLYKELYELGWIDESFSTEHSFNEFFIHTIIGGESDYPDELYERVIQEINKVKEKGFNRNDLIRIKRKFTGRYISSFNSLQAIASLFTNYYIKGMDSFKYLDLLEEITYEYILEVFNSHFDEKYAVLSIVESDGDELG